VDIILWLRSLCDVFIPCTGSTAEIRAKFMERHMKDVTAIVNDSLVCLRRLMKTIKYINSNKHKQNQNWGPG
jgi:hypothetical protein